MFDLNLLIVVQRKLGLGPTVFVKFVVFKTIGLHFRTQRKSRCYLKSLSSAAINLIKRLIMNILRFNSIALFQTQQYNMHTSST